VLLGRIGTMGQEPVEIYADEIAAGAALAAVARVKRQRGYQVSHQSHQAS
jgi:predicted DNA-binding WGR domain protein